MADGIYGAEHEGTWMESQRFTKSPNHEENEVSENQVNGHGADAPNPTVEAVKAVSDAITPLLKSHDPRAVVQGLLMSAVSLSTKIVAAKKWTNQDVAMEFSQALCATLEPQEESRIQVADATGRIRRQ